MTGPRPAVAVAVAVVFVATNERDLLLAALDSLRASTDAAGVEVVVVDNASTDGTGDAVRRCCPDVRVFSRDRRRGLSDNLNIGIRSTTAPLVLVCNADVEFQAGAVDVLARFLDDHPAAGMAAPKLVSPDGETWPSARRWYTVAALIVSRWPWVHDPARFPSVAAHLYLDWDQTDPRTVDWVLCAATMLRRSALDEVGLMDERFRIYFGDVDLAWRMHQAGWDVWSVPAAEVVHHWQRASRRPLSGPWFSHLASLITFAGKHRRLRPVPAPVRR